MNRKPVVVEATIQYIAWVPDDWDDQMLDFHFNDGSSCADNQIDYMAEIAEYLSNRPDDDYDESGSAKFGPACFCEHVRFNVLRDATDDDLKTVPRTHPPTSPPSQGTTTA